MIHYTHNLREMAYINNATSHGFGSYALLGPASLFVSSTIQRPDVDSDVDWSL